MEQIERQRRGINEPERASPLRPSDVFDIICGTSTGGLIAIMLGRLEMVPVNFLNSGLHADPVKTVEQAIEKYQILSETVFSELSKSPTSKFNHSALEKGLKQVIMESPLNLQADALLPDENRCKTFVVAIRTRAGGAAVRMRSYNTSTAYAFPAQIWEVARATSAAPTLFEPIKIKGVTYGDGGTGWNNPAAEAIAEAHKIWPNRPIGCLLSIGTGLEKAVQLGLGNGSSSEAVSKLLRKLAPNSSFKWEVAKYCVDSLTSSEKIHREVASHYSDIVPHRNYFRFNVPQGMSYIGLEEWRKIEDIIALTDSYMDHGEMEQQKIRVADLLLDPQHAG